MIIICDRLLDWIIKGPRGDAIRRRRRGCGHDHKARADTAGSSKDRQTIQGNILCRRRFPGPKCNYYYYVDRCIAANERRVFCTVEKFQIFPRRELVSHPIRKGSFLPFLVVSSLMRHLSIIVVELSQLLVLSLSESHDATTPLKVSEIGLLVGAQPSLNHRHLRPKFDLIIKWMACIFLEDCMITAIVKEMHNIKTRDIINKVALQKNHQHH